MEAGDFKSWVDRYLAAWDSNDPNEIGGLFTDDADYYTAPFRKPWHGNENIVASWLEAKDEPGDHGFRFEVLAVAGEMGFVRGWTTYPGEGKTYSNLWVILLRPDGRATEFTEWWMEEV